MLASEYPPPPSSPGWTGLGPPPYNHGGLATPTPITPTGKFDWYAATVQADPETLSSQVAFWFQADRVATRGLYGYRAGYEFHRDGSIVARMLYGGTNGDPNVWASGDDAEPLVAFLRSHYATTHRVTRADVALDFDGPGAWDALYAVCRGLVDDLGIRQEVSGDWISPVDAPDRGGRTYYLGSKHSAVRGYLYEKGRQLLDALPPGASTEGISRDAVRLELRVRPEKETRLFAARAEPVALFGMAAWGQELLDRVTGLAVERVHIKTRRASDRERALRWATSQYGAAFVDMAEELGSWEALGEHLRQVHNSIVAARESLHGRG